MIYAAIALLVIIIAWEYLRNTMMIEGFTDGIVPEYFGKFFPRRYDVVPGEMREVDGWIRNPRYFEGYVDVQNLGYKGDFCRVVEKEGAPDSRIMACALAGQEGLDSFTFRTDSARAGTRFSRDDYFRDVNGDGKDDYGRILKIKDAPNDAWQALAILAGNTRFMQGKETPDNSPPPDISDLLFFFEGIMVWYRFKDDLLDYGENTKLSTLGNIKIDEDPTRLITEGLQINPILNAKNPSAADQYIRLGENSHMELEDKVNMKEFRAFSTWVKFDTFTNNARIFDFGNGAGSDNVFLGIEGKGNYNTTQEDIKPNADNIVCNRSPTLEIRPEVYMKKTAANVDEFDCPGPEPIEDTTTESAIQRAAQLASVHRQNLPTAGTVTFGPTQP
jgi:hypothetical protein